MLILTSVPGVKLGGGRVACERCQKMFLLSSEGSEIFSASFSDFFDLEIVKGLPTLIESGELDRSMNSDGPACDSAKHLNTFKYVP